MVWRAWHRLSSHRSYISTGFGASPAPLSFEDIDRWANRFGPHGAEEFDEFLTMIMAMDGEYLTITSKRRKPKKKPGKGKRK